MIASINFRMNHLNKANSAEIEYYKLASKAFLSGIADEKETTYGARCAEKAENLGNLPKPVKIDVLMAAAKFTQYLGSSMLRTDRMELIEKSEKFYSEILKMDKDNAGAVAGLFEIVIDKNFSKI